MKYTKLPAAIAGILSLAANGALAGTISGQISDNTGTVSLAGAEIRIPALGRSTVAGANGSFRFADVDPGTYTLIVSYVGAADVEHEVTVVGDGSVRADIGIGSSTDESVIVVGQRAQMASALTRQRSSDTVDSVLTRDAIGQFPDQNVAEALRRVPGVNVWNDQGEGRFVAIRGLSAELNAVSINGARVPAPEADVRYVALDVLPVELIESIEVRKTLTPDMDADTIGASVEINTTSALDRQEPYLGFSLENSYNDLSGESSPKGSVDFSRTFGDVFGIAGGVSYYERDFSTDNIEPADWSETDGGIVFPEALEYRDYDVRRERVGMSLSFDFQPIEQILLYARLMRSEFDDQEFRNRLIFEFDEEPSSGGPDSARFLSDDGEIVVQRDLKDRYESQIINSGVIGGEFLTERWTFDVMASVSTAEEKEIDALDPTSFERAFEDPGELDITIDHRRMTRPTYMINTGSALFLDPSEYELNDIEHVVRGNSEDQEGAAEFNATREFALNNGSFELQFGAKIRAREKEYDKTVNFYELADDATIDYTLADVVGQPSYGLADIYPVADWHAPRNFFNANFDQFELDINSSLYDSAVEDYRVDEDILSYYVSGRYDNGALRIVGGFRFEDTENKMRGNIGEEVNEGALWNGIVAADDFVAITTTAYSRDYDDFYPSINVRYAIAPDVILRAAFYESLVRPSMSQLAPRFEIEDDPGDGRTGTFGNPTLDPYQASNIDISAEWYFADNAVISAGIFTKDIEDFIVVAEFDDVTFNGIFADEAEIPVNGDEATVEGIEFNYQQALTSLRGPWNGLLFSVNYTYTDTEGDIGGRTIPLPEASENVMNAVLGYERNRWSLRLAATYRSEFLEEINFGGDADEDRYTKAHTQFDISAKYNATENLQVFLDLINLTDEPYVAYQTGPVRDRLLQYEEYSWTGKLGFRMNF